MKYLFLFVVAGLAYIAVMKVLEYRVTSKRKRLSAILQEKDEKEKGSSLTDWLERKGILQYISPTFIIDEARRHGAYISKRSFIGSFFIGTLLGIIAMFIYFRPVLFLLPLALIGGVIATNIKLHNIKKEYVFLLDSKLSIYMTSLATAMLTFGNIRDALRSVLPSLEDPIKSDVEEAMLYLQDGKDAKTAFTQMNRKYSVKELKLFHAQLDVILKGGHSDVENLRNIALKMKKKEVYRRQLRTAHKQQVKAWRTFVLLSLTSPFLFMIASTDNFNLLMNNIASTIVFAITFIFIFVTYRKLEELEVYDPTADIKVDFS